MNVYLLAPSGDRPPDCTSCGLCWVPCRDGWSLWEEGGERRRERRVRIGTREVKTFSKFPLRVQYIIKYCRVMSLLGKMRQNRERRRRRERRKRGRRRKRRRREEGVCKKQRGTQTHHQEAVLCGV